MKIRLEPGEIAAVLKDWARAKYKTHNINCDFIISKNTVEAELEIIMSEDQMGGDDVAGIPPAMLQKIQQSVSNNSNWQPTSYSPAMGEVADFTPDFSGNTANL